MGWVLTHNGGRGFGRHGRGFPEEALFAGLLVALLLAALAWFVLRRRRLARDLAPAAMAATPAPLPDAAVAHLRMRYAQGDIDRDDYLARLADLSGSAPAVRSVENGPLPPPMTPSTSERG